MPAESHAAYDRAEACVIACAEAFRGDGEILASPIGLIPVIGIVPDYFADLTELMSKNIKAVYSRFPSWEVFYKCW